jgi:hypothetical protein
MTTPTKEELKAWLRRWQAIKLAEYAALVESYTEEQRELVRRMNHAARQAELCKQRLQFPDGATGKRSDQVAWPEPPPAIDFKGKLE